MARKFKSAFFRILNMDICAYLLSGESFDSGTWRQVRKLQLIYNKLRIANTKK